MAVGGVPVAVSVTNFEQAASRGRIMVHCGPPSVNAINRGTGEAREVRKPVAVLNYGITDRFREQ